MKQSEKSQDAFSKDRIHCGQIEIKSVQFMARLWASAHAFPAPSLLLAESCCTWGVRLDMSLRLQGLRSLTPAAPPKSLCVAIVSCPSVSWRSVFDCCWVFCLPHQMGRPARSEAMFYSPTFPQCRAERLAYHKPPVVIRWRNEQANNEFVKAGACQVETRDTLGIHSLLL